MFMHCMSIHSAVYVPNTALCARNMLHRQRSGLWSMQVMLETWVRIPCKAGVPV